MLHNLKKTLLFIGSSAILFAGCGDDGDTNNNDTPDAAITIDAAIDTPDAEPDTTFSGTLSVAEVVVTNPLPFTLSGAVANISFTSPADVTKEAEPGYTNNVGACRIFVYDVTAGEAPPPGSDGGVVTVAGTKAGEFACAFNGAAGEYFCSSTDAAASGALTAAGSAQLIGENPGQVVVTLGGVDLGDYDPTGSQIVLSGFSQTAANGIFPVVAKVNSNTIVVINPALLAASTLPADSTYSTIVGAGPVPGGYDFLDDGGTPEAPSNVSFTKDAIEDAPAVNTSLPAYGEGFTLADTSAIPHDIPLDGTAVTFSCEAADNGDCGSRQVGGLQGIIVFGSTTDGVLDPLNPLDMPDPVSKFATFQCSGIGAQKISLDEGAMALILGTNPTRIQSSVTYANAALATPNTIVVSHGVVGFTTVPPPAN